MLPPEISWRGRAADWGIPENARESPLASIGSIGCAHAGHRAHDVGDRVLSGRSTICAACSSTVLTLNTGLVTATRTIEMTAEIGLAGPTRFWTNEARDAG